MAREPAEDLVRLTEIIEKIPVGINHSHIYSEEDYSTVRWSVNGGITWVVVLKKGGGHFTVNLSEISAQGRYSIEDWDEASRYYHEINNWARNHGRLVISAKKSKLYVINKF